MKKITILLTFAIFLSIKLFGQCSISSTEPGNNIVRLYAAGEKLYQNEDLENGLFQAYIQTLLDFNKSDKGNLKITLLVSVAKYRKGQDLVPRQILIKLQDGSLISILADELNVKSNNGLNIQQCYFVLNDDDAIRLYKIGITTFEIIDNRTNENLLTKPYSKIIQEQIGCLFKTYNN